MLLLKHIPTLKADHSNLNSWQTAIQKALGRFTKIDGLLESPKLISRDLDHSIRHALVSSTDPVYAFMIGRASSYYDAYQSIIHPNNLHSYPRTTHATIFREIISTSFDPLTQGLDGLQKHLDEFQKKVLELDRSGFVFTRENVLSILYQNTLTQPTFDLINMDSTLRDPCDPDDAILELASEQLDAFGSQPGPTSGSINLAQVNRQLNAYLSTTIPQKRATDDAQSNPNKAQRKATQKVPNQITYNVPLACRSMPPELNNDPSASDLILRDGSAFDTPFHQYLLRSKIESVDDYNQRVKDFLNWCSKRMIYIHPQLTMQLNCQRRQLSMKLLPSYGDQPTVISKQSIMASIPKDHCFTLETSSLSTNPYLYQKFTTTSSFSSDSDSIIETIKEGPVVLRLTIHLAHELSLGSKSPWFPYLNLISHVDHHLPALIHLLVDRVPELENWFKGTEIARLMAKSDFYTLEFLKEHYRTSYPQDQITWECFLKAFTIVSSRAFEIDQYHQFGLVPVADLFDHSDEPDVEFTSQVYVCQQCGATAACLHCYDPTSAGYHRFLELKPQAIINQPSSKFAVEVRSARAIIPPERRDCIPPPSSSSTSSQATAFLELPSVYNSYGELSNSTLLTRYGFMIAANTHEKIHFERAEVMAMIKKSTATKAAKTSDLSERVAADLKALGEMFESHEDNTLVGPLEPAGLWIDANSKLSPALWLTIVHETWAQVSEQPASVELVTDLYRLQQAISELSAPTSQALPPSPTPIPELFKHLAPVAEIVVDLALARLRAYHLPSLLVKDLLDLKEEIQTQEKTAEGQREAKNRVRLGLHESNGGSVLTGAVSIAVEYSISERMLLLKVVERWDHVFGSIWTINKLRNA